MNKLLILSMLLLLMIPIVLADTLSVDKVDFDSRFKNEFGLDNNPMIITYAATTRSADTFTATLSKEFIESEFDGQVDAQRDVEFSFENIENSCNYDISTEGISNIHKKIYVWNVIETHPTSFSYNTRITKLYNWVKDNCADLDNPDNDYRNSLPVTNDVNRMENLLNGFDSFKGASGFLYEADGFCFAKQDQLGTLGAMSSPKTDFSVDFEMNVQGRSPVTKTISRTSVQGTDLKINNDVFVQWQGNLVTGDSCPQYSNVLLAHNNQEGWQTIRSDKVKSYEDYLGNKFELLRNVFDKTISTSNVENNLNSRARSIFTNSVTNTDYRVTSNDLSNGKIVQTLQSAIQLPLFRIIMDTDYISVNPLISEPKIISVSEVVIQEGSNTGTGTVIVKNDGSNKASFNVRIHSCTDGFSSSLDVGTGNLNAGENKAINFNVLFGTTSVEPEIDGTCKVTVEGLSGSDTETFSVKGIQLSECTPKATFCGFVDDKEVVLECNDVGTRKDIIETCEFGCSNGVCLSQDGTSGGLNDFKSGLIILIISFVFSGLIGGFTVSKLNNFIPDFKGSKWVFFIIFMLITILLGLLFANIISVIGSYISSLSILK